MLRILIVEDNVPVQQTLIHLLRTIPDCQVIGACASIREAMVLLDTTLPDLVLLDIALKDGSAFDLLNQLTDIPFKLIFITAFNEYAIKAIKFGALDYLLKPINKEELQQAIERAIRLPARQQEQLAVVQNQMNGRESDRIVLREQSTLRFVACRDIQYCQSDNGYTTFFLENQKKVMVSRSIKEYEKLLPVPRFYRIHQSYIVNLDYVELYRREGILILKNGTEIPVSVRKRDEVVKILTQS